MFTLRRPVDVSLVVLCYLLPFFAIHPLITTTFFLLSRDRPTAGKFAHGPVASNQHMVEATHTALGTHPFFLSDFYTSST